MSTYDRFTKCINGFINDDAVNWNFKSNPNFTYMLEHVHPALGTECLNSIKTNKTFNKMFEDNKDYITNLCNLNDSIGKPIKHSFNDFSYASPSNIRYIFHSFIILTQMKNDNLKNVDVIEIGGGYGGLCFYIHNLSKIFGINIKSYTIFDLKEPSMLQRKYLSHFGFDNVNCMTINDNLEKLNNNSFFVSTYAFSEIPIDIQKEYTHKILNRYVSHGFIAWNAIEVYKFIDDKDIYVEKEIPESNFSNNCFVRFKPITNSSPIV